MRRPRFPDLQNGWQFNSSQLSLPIPIEMMMILAQAVGIIFLLMASDVLCAKKWKESMVPGLQQVLRKGQRVAGKTKHSVIFAIPPRNMDTLEEYLHNVSNPLHAQYGRHLSREQVGRWMANSASSERVLAYLTALPGVSVTKRSLYDEYITASASVSVWEAVLSAEFHEFAHPLPLPQDTGTGTDSSSKKVIGAEAYSLPDELTGHVDAVFGICDLEARVSHLHYERLDDRKSDRMSVQAAPDGYVRPSLIKSNYNILNSTGNQLTTMAVYATIGQTLSPADLSTFQTSFSIPKQAIAVNIGGHMDDATCTANVNNCVEANLDAQYIMSTAQGVPTTFYYSDLSWSGWLSEVASMANPPKVISISYGSDELLTGSGTKSSFQNSAISLGAQGVTLVVATGDDGAPGHSYRTGTYTVCGYYPVFPAGCPYVTAVGATQGPEFGTAEVTCSSKTGSAITSGGGFSTFYSRPSFQTSFVSTYLSTVTPTVGYAAGRGYPDISLLGNKYLVVVGGVTYYIVSGTSASAPVFSGMLALINSRRAARGLSTVGWFNPALYQSSASFVRDVTSGDNKCTTSSSKCCAQGFLAAAGWDPATGLGSVDFDAMETVFVDNAVTPSVSPTPAPIGPTIAPSVTPTRSPSVSPTRAPSVQPSVAPSPSPSAVPSRAPTCLPTISPSTAPSTSPSLLPTLSPSNAPSIAPSRLPTISPTAAPSVLPTLQPTVVPTLSPSNAPTVMPTVQPSLDPSESPSIKPSRRPSRNPSTPPSISPSRPPSAAPSISPTQAPSVAGDTDSPSVAPSTAPPSTSPSMSPSVGPTVVPSVQPSVLPSRSPSVSPSVGPTRSPSVSPSRSPTLQPSVLPSRSPSVRPSVSPSVPPSIAPSASPSVTPSAAPSVAPSASPTAAPSTEPSMAPSVDPSFAPSASPSRRPSRSPTRAPSTTRAPNFTQPPTARPTLRPSSSMPTSFPSASPSFSPIVFLKLTVSYPLTQVNAQSLTLATVQAVDAMLINATCTSLGLPLGYCFCDGFCMQLPPGVVPAGMTVMAGSPVTALVNVSAVYTPSSTSASDTLSALSTAATQTDPAPLLTNLADIDSSSFGSAGMGSITVPAAEVQSIAQSSSPSLQPATAPSPSSSSGGGSGAPLTSGGGLSFSVFIAIIAGGGGVLLICLIATVCICIRKQSSRPAAVARAIPRSKLDFVSDHEHVDVDMDMEAGHVAEQHLEVQRDASHTERL